jgi:hypothetical protein
LLNLPLIPLYFYGRKEISRRIPAAGIPVRVCSGGYFSAFVLLCGCVVGKADIENPEKRPYT